LQFWPHSLPFFVVFLTTLTLRQGLGGWIRNNKRAGQEMIMGVLQEASRWIAIATLIGSETSQFAGLIEAKDIPPSKDV
jgi:hypothetical protein